MYITKYVNLIAYTVYTYSIYSQFIDVKIKIHANADSNAYSIYI